MIRVKTVSPEKLTKLNRIALLYSSIFYFIAIPVMVLLENGFLYFLLVLGVVGALFWFANQQVKELGAATLELDPREIRVFDVSGDLIESIEILNQGDIQYQPASSNFFKTITYQRVAAHLLVNTGKTIRNFPIDVDSQMLEKKLETQFGQERNPIVA